MLISRVRVRRMLGKIIYGDWIASGDYCDRLADDGLSVEEGLLEVAERLRLMERCRGGIDLTTQRHEKCMVAWNPIDVVVRFWLAIL